MAENKQDIIDRAHPMLSSLRKHVGEITARYGVRETYVHEFHAVLDKLKGIGIDVSEFRIPDSEVKPGVTSSVSDRSGSGGGHFIYTAEKYVDKAFILTKLDAILGYFEIITSEKPRRIGFTK